MSSGQRFWAKARTHSLVGGFLTVELLISVLIMSAMSSIVLSANSNMSARLQTDNLAHLIALSIREAQTRALSATVPLNSGDAGDVPGYGVYVSTTQNNQVIYFSDPRTADVAYTTGGGAMSPIPPRELGQGYTISGISAVGPGIPTPTSEGGQGSISIFFHRPRPDAMIYYGSSAMPTQSATQASIVVRSPKAGVKKTITVTSTGQISVQ